MIGNHIELTKLGFDAEEIMKNYTQSLKVNKDKAKKEEEEDKRQQQVSDKAHLDATERVQKLLKLKKITEEHLVKQE